MVSRDYFDQFGQFSKWELQLRLKQYKFKSIYSFIETYLKKYYEVCKKNKNTDISYSDYRSLMLKELAMHRNKISKIEPGPYKNSSIDLENDIRCRKH